MADDDLFGALVPDWSPPTRPDAADLPGRHTILEPLEVARHAEALFDAFDGHDALWDYLPYGPFASSRAYAAWIEETVAKPEHMFFAIKSRALGRAVGVASYLRIDPANGSIEVGNLCFSPLLKQSRIATEAMALMMDYAFSLGYRRYEWKCNALNIPSRGAAQRLGFSFEGVFRQATIVKGRNRDTSWFSVIDSEWPALARVYSDWLDDRNFDSTGTQRTSLSQLTLPLVAQRDPVLGVAT